MNKFHQILLDNPNFTPFDPDLIAVVAYAVTERLMDSLCSFVISLGAELRPMHFQKTEEGTLDFSRNALFAVLTPEGQSLGTGITTSMLVTAYFLDEGGTPSELFKRAYSLARGGNVQSLHTDKEIAALAARLPFTQRVTELFRYVTQLPRGIPDQDPRYQKALEQTNHLSDLLNRHLFPGAPESLRFRTVVAEGSKSQGIQLTPADRHAGGPTVQAPNRLAPDLVEQSLAKLKGQTVQLNTFIADPVEGVAREMEQAGLPKHLVDDFIQFARKEQAQRSSSRNDNLN